MAKIWHVEGVKTHLQAVKAGIEASVPAQFIEDGDGYAKAYLQGSQAALDYLTKRFGIDLNEANSSKKPPTGELRLRTWNKQDIKYTLEIAWILLLSTPIEATSQQRQLKSYYLGIKNTLLYTAYSFGIDQIGPPKEKGPHIELPTTF
ncbi:MAG TPA: hypothetical protein P5526_17765 [Anaerolineae bacterium]|nr:hypothetical protein [Anaerolineae bacterium]